MKIPVVDIGVACSGSQIPEWWAAVMIMMLHTERTGVAKIGSVRSVKSALVDSNKNNVIGTIKRRWSLTDANRDEIINNGFMKGGADYIFWLDDDTAPPVEGLARLLSSGRDFIAGLYFLPSSPYNPIAYKRTEETGLYEPIYFYPKGALIEVDSVGMGCTLIHRSVYEKIAEEHTVFMRLSNGSIFPVHNSHIEQPAVKVIKKRTKPFVRRGVYHEQVITLPEDDDRNFPYYLMEHGRTEDHYFCELAANVGIKPWLDTTVMCSHWKYGATTVKDYDNEIEKYEGILQ